MSCATQRSCRLNRLWRMAPPGIVDARTITVVARSEGTRPGMQTPWNTATMGQGLSFGSMARRPAALQRVFPPSAQRGVRTHQSHCAARDPHRVPAPRRVQARSRRQGPRLDSWAVGRRSWGRAAITTHAITATCPDRSKIWLDDSFAQPVYPIRSCDHGSVSCLPPRILRRRQQFCAMPPSAAEHRCAVARIK